MLRKLMIGAAAVAVIGFAAQSASAAPPIVVQPSTGGIFVPGYPRAIPGPFVPDRRIDYDYVVYVRHLGHWDNYGRFETLREAERAERFLERQGRRVRIEVVEDRRPRW